MTVLRSILVFALAALAEIGGVFVAGSLTWGMAVDGFRPDRYDLVGAALCLVGVGVIMYAPRGS
jgi:small multidrug resistance family-3 protein